MSLHDLKQQRPVTGALRPILAIASAGLAFAVAWPIPSA